jgi:tetratricopeptide (TPR) repeat protein
VQNIGEERFLRLIDIHHQLLRDSLEANGGVVIRSEGGAFFAVFDSAMDAVAAAAASQRSPDDAAGMLIESETIYRRLGDDVGVGRVHSLRGTLHQLAGEYADAVVSCERSLEYFDPAEDPFDHGWAEFVLAENLIALGELDRAADHLRAGLGSFLEAGDTSGLVLYLGSFAQLAHERGDDVRAMRLAGATKRLRGETGTGLIDSDGQSVPDSSQRIRSPTGLRSSRQRSLQAATSISRQPSTTRPRALTCT